jgi:hypothetical protein
MSYDEYGLRSQEKSNIHAAWLAVIGWFGFLITIGVAAIAVAMVLHFATTLAPAEPGAYPASPQLNEMQVDALIKQYLAGVPQEDAVVPPPSASPSEAPPLVYMFAVFYNDDKVVGSMAYKHKAFLNVEACQEFLTEGARHDEQFQLALLDLREIVKNFVEKYPDGVLRMACTTEKDRPGAPTSI